MSTTQDLSPASRFVMGSSSAGSRSLTAIQAQPTTHSKNPPNFTRVQVCCGLVQRQDAAVEAEGLRQRQPDDQAGQHLQAEGDRSLDIAAKQRR